MDYPPNGVEVIVITDNDEQLLAIWNGDYWEVGVENNPLQNPLNKTVVEWQWRTE
jgi:hypothetical protein